MPDIQLFSELCSAEHFPVKSLALKEPIVSTLELGEDLDDPESPAEDSEDDTTAEHRATHSGVLTSLYGPGRPTMPTPRDELEAWGPLLGTVGGIVVPTGRNPSTCEDGLLTVARIAAKHNAPLVILQSHEARAAKLPQSVQDVLGENPAIQIDMDQVHPSWQPEFETTSHKLTEAHRASDLAWKRTLAQMLAMRLGWKFVLFVDDDITPAPGTTQTLSPEDLAYALRAMGQDDELQLVGWPSVEFSDNSVVGHARPLIGLSQDVFISGSGMLMRITTDRMGFFPLNMFNEDWLMMIQTVAANGSAYRRTLARAGSVRQKWYEPFDLRKAHYEEAGELLGEGLMNLLEDEGPEFSYLMMDEQFWRRVMKTRHELLYHIIRQRSGGKLVLWQKGEKPLSEDPVVQCMNVAIWAHEAITPQDLLTYAENWWQDGTRWRAILAVLDAEAVDSRPVSAAMIPQLLRQERGPWLVD